LEKGEIKRDALYWHYPHYHPGSATPYGAVRAGDWRLIEFYEDASAKPPTSPPSNPKNATSSTPN
jgi:hypothetical protein